MCDFFRRRLSLAPALALAVAATATTPALAVDGVIEINQASALAGGITIGDAPGFPVTLTMRGSYRLTGELNVPTDTDGIVLQNDQIHLDMNGFSVVGGGGTTGSGVKIAVGTLRSHTVENGYVRGMGHHGIDLGNEAYVENVTATGNGGDGIQVNEDGLILRCTAKQNALSGISSLRGTRILESNASENGGDGITGYDALIKDTMVFGNGGAGIYALGASIIVNNLARSNGGSGIIGGRGPVLGNAASYNDDWGLSLSSGAAYANNALYFNNNTIGTGGQVTGGVEVGPNACDATALCP